ncbi:hypothetical protein H7992_09325 [Sporosarcina sp. resist]|uniref:hypothetical protein n=1 Tax=Sporosarcina sp. resist TaxID=2762563 RepID=UPI00164D9934|nr:hypothetical protein [Sporosarcina sp. resist]QNK89826.1 hypothetical protein H7992_09325 [Sporosarcina sp. resist]
MRTVPRPNFSTDEVILKCISNYEDEELVSRFKDSIEEIVEWGSVLKEKIETNTVHTIEEDSCIPRIIDKAEMIKLYNDKFSKQGQPGRDYYNTIMELPKHLLCPLCGYRPVDSIDHYLPKGKFPVFSISPLNLIPACFGCNKRKKEKKANKAEEEFLHPYFDNIEDDLWLYSAFEEKIPLTIFFNVNPHESWDDITKERVRKHFNIFQIGQLYSSYASSDISGNIYNLKKIYDEGGASALKNELFRTVESFQYAQVNSWQTAMYSALYNSEWFCEEALNYSIEDILK